MSPSISVADIMVQHQEFTLIIKGLETTYLNDIY